MSCPSRCHFAYLCEYGFTSVEIWVHRHGRSVEICLQSLLSPKFATTPSMSFLCYSPTRPDMCFCKGPLLCLVWVVVGGCEDINGLIISFGVCTVMLAGTQLIAHNELAEIGSTSTRITTCSVYKLIINSSLAAQTAFCKTQSCCFPTIAHSLLELALTHKQTLLAKHESVSMHHAV